MKIFLKAYMQQNLGDDLFIKIITERYKDEDFITVANNKYKKYNFQNLKIINNKISKIINKINNKNNLVEKEYEKKCDFSLILGGSMFIEGNKLFDLNNKYMILGSNFGPYKTKQYYEYYHNFFSKAVDVSFRDSYSYKLFKDLKNVRFSPDIVFSLDLSKTKIIDSKKAIISIINCEKRNIDKKKYEKSIIDLIYKLNSLNYKVVLMSFCKKEGDEKAIESILKLIDDKELKKQINIYKYRGNIDEALNIIGDSKVIIGSRFHANILGLIMNKVVIPIVYSDKTINTLKDLNFKGKIFDIRTDEILEIKKITNRDLEYHLEIKKQITEANNHFKLLDDIIKKAGENNE